jgi:hypothetical protein
MLIEMLSFVSTRRVFMAVGAVLEKKTGRPFDGSVDALYRWLWSVERPVHPGYAEFKALLYEPIDPRFREYFEQRPANTIRLDEIRWGGVRRDGIPPLKNPLMIAAAQADWLGDDDVVFGTRRKLAARRRHRVRRRHQR